MNRVVWFIICTLVGLELVAWSLLVPVHIRAVDARTLELNGANSPSLAAEGLSLASSDRIGPARLLLAAAEQIDADAPGREKLAAALKSSESAHPKSRVWGGPAPYLEKVFEKSSPATNVQSKPVVDLLLFKDARATLTEELAHSRDPGVAEVLRTRSMTNLVFFPAVSSASGQPLEATVVLTALLFHQDQLAPALRDAVGSLALTANRSGADQGLEAIYLDLFALGKRLNWGQLTELIRSVPDTNSLHEAAELLTDNESRLPVIYSAIHLVEGPHAVAQYLKGFPETAFKDLCYALRWGTGAARDLLDRQEPVHYPHWREKLVKFPIVGVAYDPLAEIATNQPFLGFCIKYGLCLVGVLLLARAATYLSPSLADEIEVTRPFLTGPQVVIGLGLLFLILFLTESFVARAAPSAPLPFQLKIPVASAAVRATIPHQLRAMIDKFSASCLLIFFVLQATIYVSCRMKLAEIRRQNLPSKLKLRLLENEGHLFDAGLYFGFVGTVLALILFSLGIHQFSLMAAYSSTSFGIIFVSILKIFNVRPYRRRLILDAETVDREVQAA
jgi:hypothetical protein